MAAIALDVPRKAPSLSQQTAGVPSANPNASNGATITLTGAGSFSLQAEIELTYGSNNPFADAGVSNQGLQVTANGPWGNPWQPLGAPITAAGTLAVPLAPNQRVRLVLRSGDASGVTATLS